MRKIYSVRAFLTLCILAVSSLIGGVSAMAQTTVTSVFQDAKLNVEEGTPQWSVDKAATGKDSQTGNNYRGIQWGTAKGEIVLTSADDFNNVQSVAIVASTNGSNNTISVSVGTESFGDAVTISSGTTNANKTYTFTGNATGKISIKLNDTNKSVYVKSISITYGSELDKPEISISAPSHTMNVGTELTVAVTTNSDGKITYTSSDPEVATVDAETGVVTAKKEGTVTITAKVEETETYAAASATCELTVVDPRKAPEFSFAEEVYTVKLGQSVQIQATTNSTGVITYISSNEDVVEIDGAGNVTAKAEGETTITATIAETNEYKSTTATCLIKVVDPDKPATVVTPMVFKEVTSTDQMIEGGQYIVVCKANKAAMTTVSSKGAAVNVTMEEDGSIKTVPSSVVIYTMSNKNVTGGYFNLINGDGKYLGIGSGTDLAILTDSYNAKAQWKLDEENRIACKSNVESTSSKRSILYNGSQFGHYANSNIGNSYAVAQLYRLEAVATINDKIGYTTYYTDEKYQMPEGLTGYAITEAQEAGAVVMTPAYEAGADVPANTALLIGGEAGTYGLPVLNKEVEATYTEENLLEGRRTVDNVTNSVREDVLYYKLTLLNGENPGFYWGAADGAAFEMKSATTAYLAVPKAIASGVNGFRLIMGEDDTTGIGTAATAPAAQDAAVYTLSGVRVNAATTAGLPKGIYIVNGKKLLVK